SALFGRGFAAAWLLLILQVLAPQDVLSESLIASNSTVVLLAGIPGDLESETTFHDQIQSWLEILQSSGCAQQILLLCDNADSFQPKGQTGNVRVLGASRSNFVATAESLAETNP